MIRPFSLLLCLLLLVSQSVLASPSDERQWLLDLHHADVSVRIQAVRHLAETESSRFTVVLMSMATSKDAALRREAISGLAHFRTPTVELFLQSVLKDRTESAETRRTAAQALAAHATVTAADLLYDAWLALSLEDPVRVDVEQLLQEKFAQRLDFLRALETGDATALGDRVDNPLLAEALVLAATATLPRLRCKAIAGLGLLGDPRAIPVLKEALFSNTRELWKAAVLALELFGSNDAIWPLASCAGAERMPRQVKRACTAALIRRNNAAAAEVLLELQWFSPDLLAQDPELEAQYEALQMRWFPERYQALKKAPEASDEQTDIELLVDLSQTLSPVRLTDALRQARVWPRSLVPALLTWTNDPGTAPLALEALASRNDEESRQALAQVVDSRSLPDTTRRQAVRMMGRQKTEESAQMLLRLSRNKSMPDAATWARETFIEYYPEQAVAEGLLEKKLDRSGLVPMALAGALHGGIGMVLLSQAVTPDEQNMPILPGLGGAILGAGVPILLTLNQEVTPSQGVWVLSGGFWGLSEVAALGLAIGNDSSGGLSQAAYAGAFLGQFAGLTGAWLTRRKAGSNWGDVGYTNLSWVVGSLGGLGIAFQREHLSDQYMGGMLLAGGMGGLLLGGTLGRSLHFTAEDKLHTTVLTGAGAWAGALAFPAMLRDDVTVATGGAFIGSALGYALGSTLTPYSQVPAAMSLTEAGGFGVGLVLGSGLGRVVPGVSNRGRQGLMAGLGILTMGLAAGTYDETKYSVGDLTLIGLGTLWGVDQGFSIAGMAETDSQGVATGAAMVGGAGFLLGTALLSQFSEYRPVEVLGAAGMGSVGSLFGLGLGLTIPTLSDSELWALSFVGGWAGLVPTLLLSDHLKLSGGDASFMALGATWGAYQGVGIRSASGATTARSLEGALLLGSTAGLLATTVVAQFVEPSPRGVARAATGGVQGSIIGYGLASLFPQLDDRGVLSTMLSAGWAGLVVKGLWVTPRDFSLGDYTAVALGGGWGTFQGWLISRAAHFEGDQSRGAILLGLGLGLLGGELVGRAKDLETTQVALTELTSYAGSGIGAGIMMLSGSDSSTANALTTAGAGWLAKAGAGWLAPRLDFRGDDVAEYLTLQGWGLWHGAAISMAVDAQDDAMEGAMLLGLGAGFILPLVTNQFVDFSLGDDLNIAGCGVWGAWIGSWLPYALGKGEDSVLLWSTLLTDVGLLTGGLLLSPVVDMPRRRMGWIHVSGLAGVGLGSSMTAIFSSKGETVAMGSVVGSVVGLAVGSVLTRKIKDETPKPEVPKGKDAAASRRTQERELSLAGFPMILPTIFPIAPPVGTRGPATMAFGVEGTF